MQQVTVGQSSGSGWTSGVWRTRLLALCGVLLWGLTAIPAHAVLQTFTATLNGAQQVPPTASPATGSATIVLDTVTNIITINESFTGLTGTATAVHIHDAPAGSNGPVVVDLTGVPAATSGTVPQQTATLTSAQVTDLQAGNFYTNIHTAPFPGGEIRGQFVLPNVTIAKTGPASVLAGSNITYTLAITNNGLGYAQSVTLSDVLPAGVTFVSQSQPAVGPQFNLLNTGNTISDTIAILAPGASQTITVVAAIPANAAAGSTLSNTATVTTASFDPNIATNGTSTVNTTVNTQADLSVNITGPATAIPGSDVTYTITQTNNGPSDAQSTGVFGTLPSHTSLVSFTQSSGPANGAPLPPGGTQTFTLVIYIDPATPSGTILPIPANTFSTTSDTNSANNQSTFNTTVQDQITGTGNDDVLVVNATGPNSGTYQLTSNGVVGPVISFTGILSFSFNGGAGNDTLIINNPVGGLFAPVNGINYDGGGQNGAPGDSLQIVGGSETSATYTYGSTDANGHNGTITLVNGGTTALYHYTGLAPITNTGTASDIIFNLPSGDGDNLAQLGDNGNLNDGLSRLSSGNATFETTDFANPTNSLTINDSSDGETVRVSRLDNGYTSSITVNGGAGANTLTVNNSNDFAASVYNLTPTSIVGSTLPPVTYNNIQTLNVTGGQNSDTFNVQASAATTYNLDGNNPTGAPGDVLNYDAQGRAVTRGANSITSLGVQPVNYLNFETVNILNAIPRLSINNVTLAEGNSGTTNAVFTVTLDVPNSAAPVTVNYATANGTATTADNDYVATSGTLTFTPGQTTQTLIVPINGDLKFEPNETFTVNLSNAANAT
ncbi:MAG: CHRD domain-containing protein, partial [Abitibacteriaceae bacterium]|nr:CHRD domain-containing protein [Abditibacteriaceae bacterium]